jgi:enoyl-[acyl-carrier-protein] reductase (NADH)
MPGFGIDDIIISQEAELDLAKRNRDRALGEVKAILATAKQENRSNLTPSEDEDIKAAQERFQREQVNIGGIEHKLEISRRTKLAENMVDEQLAEQRVSGAPLPNMTDSDRRGSARPAYDQVARGGGADVPPR